MRNIEDISKQLENFHLHYTVRVNETSIYIPLQLKSCVIRPSIASR